MHLESHKGRLSASGFFHVTSRFQVPPWCSTGQDLVPAPRCVDGPHCAPLLPSGRTSRHRTNTPQQTLTLRLRATFISSSLGHMPRSGQPGQCAHPVLLGGAAIARATAADTPTGNTKGSVVRILDDTLFSFPIEWPCAQEGSGVSVV